MKLGTETGSLMNHIYANTRGPAPEIGMAATIMMWSDRVAVTVISISKSGRQVTVQRDKATRIDKNGMSDSQDNTYERNPNGCIYKFRLNHIGYWVECGSKGKGNHLSLGTRREFYDFSF